MTKMQYIDIFGGLAAIQDRMRLSLRERLLAVPREDHAQLLELLEDCEVDEPDLTAILSGEVPFPFALFERLSGPLELGMDEILPKPTLTDDQRARIAEDRKKELFILSAGGQAPKQEHVFTTDLYVTLRAIQEIYNLVPHVQTRFDINGVVRGKRVVEIVKTADERLAAYCAANPIVLRAIAPRDFEKVIAEVMRGLGFDVELTARTRDGGRDVVAVKARPVAVRFLIECKQYADNRPVRVGAVRSLYGIVTDERATKGILATTSYFTQPAQEFLDRNTWVVEGRDWRGIITEFRIIQ